MRIDCLPESTVQAEYTNQTIEEYRDNPLIEALPQILSFEKAAELLSFYPNNNSSDRNLEPHDRFHCVQRLFRYFQPLEVHMSIEQRISRLIRQGYLSRNPLSSAYATDLHKIHNAIRDKNSRFENSNLSKASASGFTIIGYSGVGKTTATERVLRTYPQVIVHSSYKGLELNHYQMVWLKLDCPFDGSIKGLCGNFFMEFDNLFGTNTYSKFAGGRRTTDEMIPQMAQLARRHSLGVLVIDEIQHLSTLKSGGSEKMLNFFVTLVNTIGVPVILIGTSKARAILQGDFRQARRSSGQQGSIIWESMANDGQWELLMEGMWSYQWTKNEVSLSKEFMDVLYDESQGIMDIAVKLYAMTQIKAITSGRETITPDFIRRVAKEELNFVRPMLQALRSGVKEQIGKYEDITPIDIDAFCTKQSKVLNMRMLEERQPGRFSASQPDSVALSEDNAAVSDEGVQKVGRTVGKPVSESVKKPTKKTSPKEPDDLRYIVEEGRKEGKSAYEALKSKGVIKSPVEEFIKIG